MPSNPKQLAFEAEARASIRDGVTKLARAVKSTLGPCGRNACIDRGWGEPVVTRDGSRVAEEIELADPYENIAARLLRESADKTRSGSGDGSSTSTVLAEALYVEGARRLAGGVNPMMLVRGTRAAGAQAVETIIELSTRVRTSEQIRSVAAVAAGNDEEIGKTVADALDRVGRDGVVTIEEGKELETQVEVVEGMEFDRGFLSPHFVTDSDKMVCELRDPLILIFEEKISSLQKLLPLLEKVLAAKRPLLIVAEDVEGEVLATLVVNVLKGVLKCAAVKAPAYGERRKAMLQDLAIVTGARAVFKDIGIELDKVEIDDLGRAKKVRITSEDTTIVEGAGKKKDIEARVVEIRRELENTTSDYDREKLQERLAKLAGGVAVIKVGAATESAMKEKKARFESALSATRAAVEEGIVPGGGTALFRASERLAGLKLEDREEQFGVDVVRKALEAPLRQICANGGIEPGTVVRGLRGER